LTQTNAKKGLIEKKLAISLIYLNELFPFWVALIKDTGENPLYRWLCMVYYVTKPVISGQPEVSVYFPCRFMMNSLVKNYFEKFVNYSCLLTKQCLNKLKF